MVAASVHHGARCVKVHWPNHLGVDDVQHRVCLAFGQPWRSVRAILRVGGRDLFEFEKPWIWSPRHSKVEAEVSFEARPPDEIAELYWHPGYDGDDSDGWTTSSEIAEAVDSVGF